MLSRVSKSYGIFSCSESQILYGTITDIFDDTLSDAQLKSCICTVMLVKVLHYRITTTALLEVVFLA